MKWIPRLFIMTLVSVAVAAGLSYALKLEESAAVFKATKPVSISNSNLVDVVSRIPLQLRIRRVEMNHGIVSIDLLAATTTEASDLMKDLYEIPKHLFSASTNINQTYIRVLDGSQSPDKGNQVLVAVDARREKWLPEEPKLAPNSAEEIQTYLDSHYRMTYTPKWQARVLQKS